MSDMAFALRARCGCVVSATVQDDATLHYVDIVAAWKRTIKLLPDGTSTIERVTVEAAKAELARTVAAQAARGRRHWRTAMAGACRKEG